MKRTSIFRAFLIVTFFLLAVGVSSCTNRNVPATATEPNQGKEATTTPVSAVTDTSPTQPGYRIFDPELSVIEAGLTASLNEVRLDPQNPTVRICVELPSTADWLAYFSARLNNEVVNIQSIAVLNTGDPAENQRCFEVTLAPGSFDLNNISGSLVISLDSLKVLLPEKLPSTSEIVAAAKAEAQKQGIDFEIQDLDHTQDIRITQKPTSMSNGQAQKIVVQLLQTEAGEIIGPWVFTIDLSQ
jgi:predicted regulator of Ras-like GTPase activity (Roadblock/LC7/MglB family)